MFDKLPIEITQLILDEVHKYTVPICSFVCKQWKLCVQEKEKLSNEKLFSFHAKEGHFNILIWLK